jgi:hypothetical protein
MLPVVVSSENKLGELRLAVRPVDVLRSSIVLGPANVNLSPVVGT